MRYTKSFLLMAAAFAWMTLPAPAQQKDSADRTEQTAPDKSGALVHTVGKWMSVFRKQPDGSWGAVADTFNVDPAP